MLGVATHGSIPLKTDLEEEDESMRGTQHREGNVVEGSWTLEAADGKVDRWNISTSNRKELS